MKFFGWSGRRANIEDQGSMAGKMPALPCVGQSGIPPPSTTPVRNSLCDVTLIFTISRPRVGGPLFGQSM